MQLPYDIRAGLDIKLKAYTVEGDCHLFIAKSLSLMVNGARVYVHRLVFMLHNGSIPKGKVVTQSCKNKRCINPAHLILLTNSYDKVKKFCHRGHEKRWAKRSGRSYCPTCLKQYKKVYRSKHNGNTSDTSGQAENDTT